MRLVIFAWSIRKPERRRPMAGGVKSDNGGGTIAEINVIPLVYIILVVLIIFMVAAPLVMQPKIDITLPSSSTAKIDKDKNPMKIVLGKQGQLFLKNKPTTVEGLQEDAKKMVAVNPEISALLVADKEATLAMVTQL